MADENAELTSLSALRGAAILSVIVAHFTTGLVWPSVTTLFGNAGVILFFFLSGFLMDRTLSQDRNLTAYAVRRAFRILPLYWLSLLLVAISTRGWTFGQLLANVTFTAPVVGAERMSGVYWSLYVEVLFYCLAPLLVLSGRHVIQSATYVALAIFSAIVLFHGVEKGAGFYLIFCLCGLQIGAWYRGELSASQMWLSTIVVCMAAAAFAGMIGFVALGCAALLVAGLKFPSKLPVLEFFGKISYSWYLLHSVLGYALMLYLAPSWCAIPVAVMATLALSVLTYWLVEAPAVSVGRFLCARYSPHHDSGRVGAKALLRPVGKTVGG